MMDYRLILGISLILLVRLPVQLGAKTADAPQSVVMSEKLATVNGEAITLADLEVQVRDLVEKSEKQMPDLRKDALEARINTMLLESEALRRKVTVQRLMDSEIGNAVKDPSDAEIQAVYDTNRQQIGSADLASVRPQIISYLRSQMTQRLSDDLIKRLRQSHNVVMGTVNVNAPNLRAADSLAVVDGKVLTAGEFNERLKPFVYKLQREVYEAEMHALDLKLNQTLLEAQAKLQNKKPEDIYNEEVSAKLHEPTEAEVAKFYETNKARISTDLNAARKGIAELLKNEQLNRLEAQFAQHLRSSAAIQIFLKEPQPPVLAIRTDGSPARGSINATVTIVEFTDFECLSCAAMNPVVDEVMKNYGNRVRLVVRNFPLSIHQHARKAAEAAIAADAQGKFFEYIATLFKNQTALDLTSLKKYAGDLSLDRALFDAALDSGRYAERVNRDIDDAEAYGVEGTPTIFINGIILRDLSAEGLRAAIDRALNSGRP